jgi:hypothetical protein
MSFVKLFVIEDFLEYVHDEANLYTNQVIKCCTTPLHTTFIISDMDSSNSTRNEEIFGAVGPLSFYEENCYMLQCTLFSSIWLLLKSNQEARMEYLNFMKTVPHTILLEVEKELKQRSAITSKL